MGVIDWVAQKLRAGRQLQPLAPLRALRRSAEVLSTAKHLPVGMSPRQEVWSLNKTKLYRYASPLPPEARRKTPLLFVYSLVNKPYIFDLRPGRSMIEYLAQQGVDVFLLDWGTPGLEDKTLGLDTYALDYLPRAVRAMRQLTGRPDFALLGYCLGAVEALLYAAMRPDPSLRGMVLLTPPVEFECDERSAFSNWFADGSLDIDQLVRTLGNIPAELVEHGAKMLKPVDNYVNTYSGMLDKIDDDNSVEGWQALHRWVHEGVPFAGEAFRQWATDFVRENRLMRGTLAYQGIPVSLSAITAPALLVVAENDHIVPPSQSLPLLDKLGSQDKELYRVPAGHVGLVIGRSAKNGLWPKVSSWLSARMD